MRPLTIVREESGFALLIALMLTLVVGALAVSSVTLFGNATLINVHAENEAEMEEAAMAGTELGRSLVNRRPVFYPDSGFTHLPADSVRANDAFGRPLTSYSYDVYVGPSGVSTGQFGVFGAVVSVVEDSRGTRKIFRREIIQESFAKYAYFTDKETSASGNPIYFAPGDQLFGPVHSNDVIKVMASSNGPIFHGPVTTHEYVSNDEQATFRQGLSEGVGRIELPDLAELSRLQTHAVAGNTSIVSTDVGNAGEATTRIEFVAIDIDGDGLSNGPDEGFYKVYKAALADAAGARWVVGGVSGALEDSPNCGHRHIDTGEYFYTAAEHVAGALDADGNPLDEASPDSVVRNLSGGERARCYLGGSDSLSVDLQFVADDGRGAWQPWGGSWASPMPAAISSRADAAYLVPLGRTFNPNFKGVIYVAGKVAISGTLRGRVTLATTGNIVVADDMQYATDPAAAACQDILGLFAGGDVVVADNTVNAPQHVGSWWEPYRSYDNTTDEIIHGVVLTLGSFTVENYGSGSGAAESCEGSTAGRGCLYLTGGIIQDRRGAVGQTSLLGGMTGYLKRYSYDQCAGTNPPPYFPTTGYFTRGRIFEVNPMNFEVGEFFERISAG